MQNLTSIHSSAKLGENVHVDPFTTIHNNVGNRRRDLDRIQCNHYGRGPDRETL
jgi:hypothetical protein